MTEDRDLGSQVQALKSTSIIGGSTAIVMVVRMVRTKTLAVLLGPAGIGLEAVFDSAVGLTRTLFDLGISASGVRQIASAVGTQNDRVIATTVYTLRRTCLLLGTAGAVTFFLAREPIGRLAFGNSDHGAALGWLAIILLFGALSGGQGALLQGMRQIRDLAKMNILGALTGAFLSIPIVFIWGQAGIPAYMVMGAGVALFISWSYARRIRFAAAAASLPEIVREAGGLLKLGLAFMSASLIAAGAMFLLRIMVTRRMGVDGVGQFQAASSLSMVYVSFILQAMSTDYYPRLTALAGDNVRCNRSVNEQAEISLLLALPGILATLALAPWVIRIFYSGRFPLAADILAWQIIGALLQVISWPMGFIILAKGRGAVFVWTDAAAYSIYILLAWLGLKFLGLQGVGIAYLGLYAFHWVMIYAVVRRMSGYRWSTKNVRLIVLAVLSAGAALGARQLLSDPWATIVGCSLALAAAVYCLRKIVDLVGIEEIRRYSQRIPFIGSLCRKPAG
jgi:enterobacterial common antigen flippase